MFVVTVELVGKELAALRKRAGLTQDALGALVGVKGSAVGQWEQGKTKPTWQNLQRLAGVFGVTVVSPISDPNADWGDRLDAIRYDLDAQKEVLDRLADVVELTQEQVERILTHLGVEHLAELGPDADSTPPG